tara:strand:- start:2777 stop:3967 length:1191 start_codon:yes stop_codon:yes gene_type:complete
MSDYVPEGALMPNGIEVDETAAYFGITESSQILLDLEESDRLSSLAIVLNKISDLLLTDTFDLDSGSNRLKVESGEIYYILTGPLQLIELTENLQTFLGLNPEKNSQKPNISISEFSALETLLDPINILRIYAIGDVTGGNEELAKYVFSFDEMIKKPDENWKKLVQIEREMTQTLTETKDMKMPNPISVLKSSERITPPRVVNPQNKKLIGKSEKIDVNKNLVTTNQLQKPEILEKPKKLGNIFVEATPLPKPKINSARNSDKNTDLVDLEKESINTRNWIKNDNTESNIENNASKQKIVPKSKPISRTTKTTINTPVSFPSNKESFNKPEKLRFSSNGNLPKPIQKINFNEKHTTVDRIIRTFPNGQICKKCKVSLNNSWRFCPICGFNTYSNL